MAVADKLRVEHRCAPRASGLRGGRRMRRAHDPSGFRGRGQWLRRHPQHQAGHAGHLRGQRQLAAGDEIQLSRLAPDFQHHDAERIAGQRVGGGSQRGVDIGRAHAHHAARIEPEFGPSAHRQRAQFDFGKILPYPDQRPARRHASREPCDESGRRSTLMTFGKHLMHRGEREATLQCRIRTGMAERRLVKGVSIAMRFEALNVAAQIRKRVHACAHHAPLPQMVVAITGL